MTEWEFGSIDIFGDGQTFAYFIMLLFGIVGLSLLSPICLLISIFVYRGRIPKASLVGFISAAYYLIDASNNWIANKFAIIMFGEELTKKFIILACISILGQLILSLISIVTKGTLFTNDYDNDEAKDKSLVMIVIAIITFIIFLKYLF